MDNRYGYAILGGVGLRELRAVHLTTWILLRMFLRLFGLLGFIPRSA